MGAAAALPRWDLSDLYGGIDTVAIKRDLKTLEQQTHKLATSLPAKLDTLSGDKLAALTLEYEEFLSLAGKLSSYAQLEYATQATDAKVAQFYQNIYERVNNCSAKLLPLTLGLNKIADASLKKKLKESAKLRRYEPWLREVRAFRPYQLSDELETMLHEKSVTDGAWQRLFDETHARLKFPYGKKQLGSAEIFDLLSSPKREVRKEAAASISKVLAENSSLLTLVMNTIVKNKAIEDKARKFATPISSRNVANQLEDEVVKALLTAVQRSYKKLSHRYYQWKAEQLGLKKMEFWDRNAPLPGGGERNYSWNEARETVLSAYTRFSPTMAKVGKQFFDKPWIDAAVYPGKSSGAFAHPTVPDAHPYLLVNFQGKTRDVMTLAHELGHGVHQVLAAPKGVLLSDTPLTLAETASVFGEMLVFQSVLEAEKNEKKRKLLIASKVEDMLNTLVRQTAFCLFEKRVHDERKKGELSPEQIGEIWMAVQKESLGSAFHFAPEYHAYWSYIPHFIHTPFYVYAYAFGDCLVNALYAVYQKEKAAGRGKQFEQKYIEMLKAGGTLRHKELLAPFGLDASKPDFWQQGLNIVSGYIDELVS